MMQANGEVLDALRSNIHGELIEPEHAEYAAAVGCGTPTSTVDRP